MADSLFDILAQKNFEEPAEIAVIKQYVRDLFEVDVEVLFRERDIILTVTSAALASTLRFHLHELQAAAKTDKRIVLRIR